MTGYHNAEKDPETLGQREGPFLAFGSNWLAIAYLNTKGGIHSNPPKR